MYICEKCHKKYRIKENKPKNLFPLVDFLFYDTQSEKACRCGGNIVEMKKCEKCGKDTVSEYALCLRCISEYKTLDTALDIGDDWNETLEINGFLHSFFSKDEIEQILIETLKQVDEPILDSAILEYCNDDELYFKEYIEKKWKKRI